VGGVCALFEAKVKCAPMRLPHLGWVDLQAMQTSPQPIDPRRLRLRRMKLAASGLLVPEGLTADTWARLTGIERFMFKMLDMETTGASKLDNYQNFAKAFHVEDYARVMGDMRPNHARLKRVSEYPSRELTDATEIGASRLGRLIIALQQLSKDTEPQVIVDQLRSEMADFLEARSLLVDMLVFIERKSPEPQARNAAELLGSRLKNLRFGD